MYINLEVGKQTCRTNKSLFEQIWHLFKIQVVNPSTEKGYRQQSQQKQKAMELIHLETLGANVRTRSATGWF